MSHSMKQNVLLTPAGCGVGPGVGEDPGGSEAAPSGHLPTNASEPPTRRCVPGETKAQPACFNSSLYFLKPESWH